jgi:hypothetical protein
MPASFMKTGRLVNQWELPIFVEKSEHEELSQFPVTSPKRADSERQGLHAWHPYYAGFSEGFVRDILSALKVPRWRVILDPMNGSGTTTVVAQQCDYLAIGVELNPAMAIISRAKDPTFWDDQRLVRAAAELIHRARRRKRLISPHEDSVAWIPSAALADLKRLDAAILERDAAPLLTLDSRLKDLIAISDGPGGGTQDFLRAALLITARRASIAQDSKNPTWLKRGNGQPSDAMDVLKSFRSTVTSMAADIKDAFFKQPDTRHVAIIEADARNLPLRDRSVDAIVTSPPYLTRIDYAVSTAPELVFLGYESEEDFRTLRRSIMGSTCITGGPYGTRTSWGKTCLETIEQVRQHPSKASSGYYFKMHLQYFQDAEAILRECLRVLKPGAPAVFVIQDSWYKDIHIGLGRIYVEMARMLGATHAETIRTEVVRNPIGQRNTRARRYPKGALHEHVVLFRR